jgi:ATP-dependent Clp protease adaptor protein ClpS
LQGQLSKSLPLLNINYNTDIQMSDTAIGTINKTENITGVKEPDRFRVVILNDNSTPMEFVIELLKIIFHHSQEAAVQIMMQVHQNGKGTAGIYSYEVAEQKAAESTQIARTNGHPLGVSVELAG